MYYTQEQIDRANQGYLKAGERPDYEHEGRRRKIFGRFLGQSGTPLLFRADRLHLVRGHGGRKELHHAFQTA